MLDFALRTVGCNPTMSQAYGINIKTYTIFGLSLSNGLIGLAGSLYTQLQGFADLGIGTGTVVSGVAGLVLGETLFSSRSVPLTIFACIVGAVLHRTIVTASLPLLNTHPSDLFLITSLLLIALLSLPKKRIWKQKTGLSPS